MGVEILQKSKTDKNNSNLMINSFETIISYVSTFITLRKGDLIFTGTPAGVGPIQIGDTYEGYLEGNPLLYVKIK